MPEKKKKETFGSQNIALGMRDIITKMVEAEIKRMRPEYSYATVVRISRRFGTCRVAFPGDLGEADVRLGGVVPAYVGQVVRIDGLPNDRTIVDVMGHPADNWPGVVVPYPAKTLPHAGYKWADGTVYSMDTYPDLAFYRGYLDTYEEQILATLNVSGYYRLGETSGTTCADSSGLGNNCTYTGSPTLGVAGAITGDSNTSATFAAAKYASRASGSSPWGAATVNQRHVSGWVFVTSASMRSQFFGTNGVAVGVGNVDFTANGNRLIILYNGVRWINTGLNLGTGWHHVGVSVQSLPTPLVNVFYDGILAYTDTLAAPTAANSVTTIGIGFDLSLYPWADEVDEVVFVNRFLYANEVQVHYLRGKRQLNVPDMRSCVPVGLDAIGGGAAAGRITGVTQILDGIIGVQNELHTHPLSDLGQACIIDNPGSSDIRQRLVASVGWTTTHDSQQLTVAGSTNAITQGAALRGATDPYTISHLQPGRLVNWIVKT